MSRPLDVKDDADDEDSNASEAEDQINGEEVELRRPQVPNNKPATRPMSVGEVLKSRF